MTTHEDTQDTAEAQTPEGSATASSFPRWVRRELIIAGILIPIGVLLLPVAIYFTGQALLGQYSDQGEGIGKLYSDIFRDVGAGSVAAIVLVLSPWLGIQLLRLAWRPLRRKAVSREAAEK